MYKLYFNDGVSDFEYSTTLSGIEYIFRFYWNDFSGSWYMTLKDYSGAVVVQGIRLTSSNELVSIYKTTNIPDGYIMCLQTNLDTPPVPPTRYSFSDGTHYMVYIPYEEI